MGAKTMVRVAWQAEIERLAAALEDADLEAFPSLARALHNSLSSAPPEVASALGATCSRSRLDTLLMSGASREAAFELLGRIPYAVSRSGDDRVSVTVISELFPETNFASRHEATAFTGALAVGLRDWARATSMSLPARVIH